MDAATPTNPPRRTPSRTPNRAQPSRRSVHTPLDHTATRDLLGSIRRGTPASAARRNAPTPHAKAARLAVDQRRTAMFTPGKVRRQSLMRQRETPLGILRDLGRVLAPVSRPVVTSSSPPPRDRSSAVGPAGDELDDDMYFKPDDDGDDDDDDERMPARPRFSLPIDADDSSDSDPRPPRLSAVGDDTVEIPRRDIPTSSRLSRGSFGSVGMSDALNEPTENFGRPSDFFPGLLDDIQQGIVPEEDSTIPRFDADQTAQTMGGRESTFQFELPEGVGDQTSFQMSDPGDDMRQTSPIQEQSITEAVAMDTAHSPETATVAEAESESDVGGPDVGGPDFEDDNDHGGFGLNESMGYGDGALDDHSSVVDEADTVFPRQEPVTAAARSAQRARKKQKRISQHGIEYPPLPTSFVKRVAQTALQSSGLSNQRISADTLDALTQASEWFFEQLGDDLGAYADHAKRKTIEESDVLTLMKRQRQVGSRTTMFSLAQKHLPRELLQDMRMPLPQPVKQRRAKRVREDDDEEEAEAAG